MSDRTESGQGRVPGRVQGAPGNGSAQDDPSHARPATPEISRTSGVAMPALCPPRLVDLHEAGAYLSLSYWTVRDLVFAGKLPTVRVPGVRRILIDRHDLDRLIEAWKETEQP